MGIGSRSRFGRFVTAVSALGLVAGAVAVLPMASTAAPEAAAGVRQADFTAAAKEFAVPEPVLLAVSYLASRWDSHRGQPSVSGGYGPMHLTDVAISRRTATGGHEHAGDRRGDPARPVRAQSESPSESRSAPAKPAAGEDTLSQAAGALRKPLDVVRTDPRENVRGAAALLAAKARAGGRMPTSLAGWRSAVAAFGGAGAGGGVGYAESVYDVLRTGAARTTAEGQRITLAPQPSAGSAASNSPGNSKRAAIAECPVLLGCDYVPAAYAKSDPGNDPGKYGNYDLAKRPTDLKVDTIVIHDTEETYAKTLKLFKDKNYQVSSHYVIRSNDGQVTQMVKNRNVGFHAGNWNTNTHSVGIEHEGYAEAAGTWYTEAMYRNSAKLVKYLATKYQIPLDRQHIIGHDNVPALTTAKIPAMHWDPGAYWKWDHYFELLGAPLAGGASSASSARDGGKSVVTMLPADKRQERITKCGKSEPLPGRGTSVVQLYTQPSESAPLLADPGLHPNGEAGTREICDWGNKANSGQEFAVAERKKGWTAIWYAGQKAWFPDTAEAPATRPGKGQLVTPKAGKETVPVYGSASPDEKEFPKVIPPVPPAALPYTLKTGQRYVTTGLAPTDYYYAKTIDSSKPLDHTVVRGKQKYYRIQIGHRIGYVNAADVTVSSA